LALEVDSNCSGDYFENIGLIKQIDDNGVWVSFPRSSACSNCHAKSGCLISDTQEMSVFVKDDSKNYELGQKVKIQIKKTTGLGAVFFSYILPLVLLLAVLISVFEKTQNDLYAGLASVAILVPYYLAIYIFKGALKNKLDIKIIK
jgi:sigma-E factor negative regulatory protein RseC